MISNNYSLIKNERDALISYIRLALIQSNQSDRLKSFYSCFSQIWTSLDKHFQPQPGRIVIALLSFFLQLKTNDKSPFCSVDIVILLIKVSYNLIDQKRFCHNFKLIFSRDNAMP